MNNPNNINQEHMAEFLDCITKVIAQLEKSLLAYFGYGSRDE
jgi:hypothetical protein